MGCPQNADSCFRKITFPVFGGCNGPKIKCGMSQKHRFLFSENHFPRFQGVQRSENICADVPKTPILVFGKSLSPFSGGATVQNAPFGPKNDPKMKNKMLDVPKTPNLVFGKSLSPFLGGATKYIKNIHYIRRINPTRIMLTKFSRTARRRISPKCYHLLSFCYHLGGFKSIWSTHG